VVRREDVAPQVFAILSRYAGERVLSAELPLGASGLGLDSIAIAEVLLECERAFGVEAVEPLLAGPPLTVGSLLAHAAGTVRS
jgi:acyl carrier protein